MNTTADTVTSVDSYRFLDGITRRMIKTWVGLGHPAGIPWTPLTKPLSECNVAMVTSGGIALKTDRPFDQDIERQDPWWSDPTYRLLPRSTTSEDVEVYHLHINPDLPKRDLNCILPLERLAEMEQQGEIGQVAPTHYSFMGYTQRPQQLLDESVPAIADHLRQEQVDCIVLVPV